MNYENDPHVYNMNDEYMVGEDILTAPVVQEGQTKRAVYLPEGEWIDFWHGVEYAGRDTILVDAPIDKLPLFIKKNTILPWGKEVSHISDEPDQEMTFRVFGKRGKYTHYQDNGLDFKYENGEYNLYDVEVDGDQVTVKLTHHGYAHEYQRIVVESADRKVILNYCDGEYIIE